MFSFINRLICKFKGHAKDVHIGVVYCKRCFCCFNGEYDIPIVSPYDLKSQFDQNPKEIWILPSIEEQIKNDIYEDRQ